MARLSRSPRPRMMIDIRIVVNIRDVRNIGDVRVRDVHAIEVAAAHAV
jgi:hypothetical protein